MCLVSSFVSGIFLKILKFSKFNQLKKQKAHELGPRNDCPISILPIFFNVFERAIYDEEQHGFWAGKSVTTASIDLIETIVSTVDRGDSVTGVFIDLSKAIDSVHHVELLNALENLGITG